MKTIAVFFKLLAVSIVMMLTFLSTVKSQDTIPINVCYGEPINLYCNLNNCFMPGATFFWTNSSGAWTSAQSDNFILPGTAGYAEDVFRLTLNTAPPDTQAEGIFSIHILPLQTLSGTTTDVECYGSFTGAISTTVSGGAGPYEYFWSDGQTTLKIDSLAAGDYSVTITDQNSCSKSETFTVSQATINCNLLLRDLAYDISGNICYDATQTITTAGDGTTFTISDGDSATMIAGQKITYLPGTTIYPGGLMHGFITTDGQYCSLLKSSPIASSMEKKEVNNTLSARSSGNIFHVYPNPTTGLITLDRANIEEQGPLQVELFNMRNEKVVSLSLAGGKSHTLSLSDRPSGIYLLRMFSNGQVASVKIVKQ
ncbi:MAG: T9SS type A sorting domain-containing protein [Bacteroidetes bacterium]|nr:T9SS type A sorting domain-containing protein [Bacteroidota bacterium]